MCEHRRGGFGTCRSINLIRPDSISAGIVIPHETTITVCDRGIKNADYTNCSRDPGGPRIHSFLGKPLMDSFLSLRIETIDDIDSSGAEFVL